MQRNFLRLSAIVAFFLILNWGCTKIDSTELGQDLIPAVDNVTTFADTLYINAENEPVNDTIRLSRTEIHALGSINNDAVFGKIKADIFLELKPSFFPFYFGNSGDTINPALNSATHFDSAFLCLSYTTFYGDTTKPQHFKVYALDPATNNFADSVAQPLDFKPAPAYTKLIGEGSVYQPDLKNYIFLKNTRKDSITQQIRIKLDTSMVFPLLARGDSGVSNIYNSDSLFKEKIKGFAVVADGGNDANGLFYVNLADAATRLEIHYVAANAGKLDSAFTSFPLSLGSFIGITASASANHIEKDTSSAEFPAHKDPKALYIQAAPGYSIGLRIPDLKDLSNRIIHRAEITLEQAPGSAVNDVLTAPSYLYLDLYDDTAVIKKFKPLYFDLSPNNYYNPDATSSFFPTNGIDFGYYGGYLRSITDNLGTRSYYSFNLTRYVQSIATKAGSNYKLRVYAPYELNYNGSILQYKNNLAAGRIKINNDINSKHRIRMRIVYSKI